MKGEDCELEIDACKDQPCLGDQKCTDRKAAEQGNSPVGYSCGPCPDGFEERDSTCVGGYLPANCAVSV